VFHDEYNQQVHRAAPGLLGLIEARPVIGRWKPRSLAWLDGTDHFFNHLYAEFDGEPAFAPLRRELAALGEVDAPWPARNAFLFQYLAVVARELERAALDGDGPTLGAGGVPGEVSLQGPWTARYCAGDRWVEREVDVPVNWELLPGIANYAGTMRFTRVFRGGAAVDAAGVTLRSGGADYFADVWLNGHHLGGHEGYFGPFEFDVTSFLRPDGNVLRVAVTSPNDPSGTGTHVTSGWHDFSPASAFPNRKTLVKGTLGHHDAKRGGAWSSVTGQDGNTGGLWNDVALRLSNAVRLDPQVRVTTMSTTPDRSPEDARASVRVQLIAHNSTGGPLETHVRLAVEPSNFAGRTHELAKWVRLAPGENQLAITGALSPVRLWSPRDHGFPHLYRVTAVVEAGGEQLDRTAVETGFRILSVSPIGESTGTDGAFVVNGRRVFVRGTNLLPTYWLSEYTQERVDRDFAMLGDAGFNGVLVHNLVAPKRFYEAANRNGFLVVQMFPLQWSYQQSHEVIRSMKTQIREMADLLANEPSVVSYEVHNEPDMRVFEDLDNRLLDIDLHTEVREADPSRWSTTFSSGNHAYPGQFYPLRDDNAFATLPARFLEEEVHGRRISRHRNMPTEFGIQAMPNLELFRELVSEGRVRAVLERVRNDPKWLAAGAEGWEQAGKTIDEATHVLGRGSWAAALAALDWTLLWDIGALNERIRRIEAEPAGPAAPDAEAELLSLRLALLLLDVLHYGGFKGENFWYGLWKPATTLEGFVQSGQNRQYRLHKDAIEHYLNAGVVGPIVGYFSFMFRDADWQAPTWGVVDAAWAPKKAYRAYLESNHPVRVTLPQALRSPVKLPGDPWLALAPEDRDRLADAPWAAAEIVVANDTGTRLPGATVEVWVEDAAGTRLPFGQHRLRVDLEAGSGWMSPDAGLATAGGVLADDIGPGTYFVRARVCSPEGEALSTNAYEIVVPDVAFDWVAALPPEAVRALLDGVPGADGFHYWHGGAVACRSRPGLRGLLDGWSEAASRGVDRYEVVQGEHLFRHLLDEVSGLVGGERLCDDLWTIRAEVISPAVKSRLLLRYAELFVRRAELLQAAPGRRRSRGAEPTPPGAGVLREPARTFPAVGRDVRPIREQMPRRSEC